MRTFTTAHSIATKKETSGGRWADSSELHSRGMKVRYITAMSQRAPFCHLLRPNRQRCWRIHDYVVIKLLKKQLQLKGPRSGTRAQGEWVYPILPPYFHPCDNQNKLSWAVKSWKSGRDYRLFACFPCRANNRWQQGEVV